ncbi:MAG: hypothetical protein IJB04_02445 [Oscillospiraceae bacterium]|nr:hypothetical protein [Oscillospiraceae bacterium]
MAAEQGVRIALDCLLIFWGFSLLGFFSLKNGAIGMTDSVGRKEKYFPQRYQSPSRKIRKFFHISKNWMPKFLVRQLYASLVFLCLAPVSSVIFLASGCLPTVAAALICVYVGFTALVMIDFFAGCIMFR